MTSEDQSSPSEECRLIWAFGPRSKYVHAYPGTKGLKTGVPLCGISCAPNIIAKDFRADDEKFRRIACPACLARLAFAKYLRPVAEMTGEEHTEP